MDLQMPEMDGLAATSIIRDGEQGTGRHIPILALTAHAMAGDRERCLAAGMDGYVSKPLSAKELRKAIAEVATSQDPPMRPGRVEQSTSRVELQEAASNLDHIALLDLASGSRQTIKDLADLVESCCPQLLGELRAAVLAIDSPALARAAHTLKGMLASVTARGAADKASLLEFSARRNDFVEATRLLDELELQCGLLQSELLAMAEHGTEVESAAVPT
jgi:two-component system sensor histidine kinase/response regulator